MITAIIPHVPDLEGTNEALQRCTDSLVGADEVLIVENNSIGYGRAVNCGLRAARGDFLVVLGNDTELLEGSLADLAMHSGVCTPRITPQPKDNFPRAFFCMPRWVYEEVGGFDERFVKGYYEDDDLIKRMFLAGIQFHYNPDVLVHHEHGGGLTMKQMGEQKYHEINREIYLTKWKEAPIVG